VLLVRRNWIKAKLIGGSEDALATPRGQYASVRIGSGKIDISPQGGNFGLQPEKQWMPTRTSACATEAGRRASTPRAVVFNFIQVFSSRIGPPFLLTCPTQVFLWQLELHSSSSRNRTAELASHPWITDISLTIKALKSTD
jgi:hypothetical protein